MTNTRSELYEKVFLKNQFHTLLCKSPNTDKARQSTQERTWYRKVSPPSGNKKYHIDLDDWYPIRVVRESSIQSSIPHPFVQITQLWRKRPGKCYWVKGFQQSLGFKKTPYYKELRRPGEQSRSQNSSGDWYRIKVVWENFFESSILHALTQIAQLPQSKEIHTEERPVIVKIW